MRNYTLKDGSKLEYIWFTVNHYNNEWEKTVYGKKWEYGTTIICREWESIKYQVGMFEGYELYQVGDIKWELLKTLSPTIKEMKKILAI